MLASTHVPSDWLVPYCVACRPQQSHSEKRGRPSISCHRVSHMQLVAASHWTVPGEVSLERMPSLSQVYSVCNNARLWLLPCPSVWLGPGRASGPTSRAASKKKLGPERASRGPAVIGRG